MVTVDEGGPPPRSHRGGAEVRARRKDARPRRQPDLQQPGAAAVLGSDDLGAYGLGTERSLRDYEVYAGFDFERKRAHPDVFTGRPPDPVTIRSVADWVRCCTAEEAFQGNPERTALPSLA